MSLSPADDLTLAEDVVARAAICLDDARRFTRERGIALFLQSTLLPRGPIVHPGAETATRYLPRRPRQPRQVGLVRRDPPARYARRPGRRGHRRPRHRRLGHHGPAPDGGTYSRGHRSAARRTPHPPRRHGDPPGGRNGRSAGRLRWRCRRLQRDPRRHRRQLSVRRLRPRIRYLHAGPSRSSAPDSGVSGRHHAGRRGAARRASARAGQPAVRGDGADHSEGSLLALFTDGLVETRGHDIDERIDELRDALARSVPSLEELCDTVLESLHTETRTDDIALLVARTRLLRKEQVAEWDVPADAAAVAETRKMVDERLTAWKLRKPRSPRNWWSANWSPTRSDTAPNRSACG